MNFTGQDFTIRSFESRATRRVAGFTLVEMLVVLSIMAVLIGLTVPALNTVLRGSQLTQGAQTLSDQLTLARQTALSSDQTVEVRFYRYGDPQIPGESASTPSSGKYRAMQAFQIQSSGTAVPLGKVQVVPNTVIIDSGTTLSSLMAASQSKTTWTTADPQVSLPRGVGTNYNCVAFRFLPDGSTNLAPASQWYITLHSLTDTDGITNPPASFNFFTVQIDSVNGHIKNYRP